MAKKLSKEEKKEFALALQTGMYKGYSVRWLKKLRAEGEPHPEADSLIEEFEALEAKQPKQSEEKDEE